MKLSHLRRFKRHCTINHCI